MNDESREVRDRQASPDPETTSPYVEVSIWLIPPVSQPQLASSTSMHEESLLNMGMSMHLGSHFIKGFLNSFSFINSLIH